MQVVLARIDMYHSWVGGFLSQLVLEIVITLESSAGVSLALI